MKRALLVGIDYYQNCSPLGGCANDAEQLRPLFGENEDGSPNLECRLEVARDEAEAITRDNLLSMIDELLAGGATFALLYFAGHGTPTKGGVALTTSDATEYTPGVFFSEILGRINASNVSEVAVILDCCFSGGATTIEALDNGLANLRNGLSVLTASRDDQFSMESGAGRGQFSEHLEGALQGGAADILGQVNVAGLYAYLSESFGAFDQRPTFKANIDRLHDIRRCAPRVELPILRNMPRWFAEPHYEHPLDHTYEPTEEPKGHANEKIFAGLQSLRAARLVEPVGEDHMYFAALNHKSCRLTALGKHYWQLANTRRI